MALLTRGTLRLLISAALVVVVCVATWILSSIHTSMVLDLQTTNTTMDYIALTFRGRPTSHASSHHNLNQNSSNSNRADGIQHEMAADPNHKHPEAGAEAAASRNGWQPHHGKRKSHRDAKKQTRDSFVVDGSDATADAIKEVIGSLRFHHPNASVVVYTKGDATTDAVGDIIHAWSFVKHISLQTIQSAYPTIPHSIVDLVTVQVAVELFGVGIFIPKGYYLTSPVARMFSYIARHGYGAEKSQDTLKEFFYGYDKKSIIFEQVELALKGCRSHCKEADLALLLKSKKLLNDSAVSTIAIPISRLDPTRSVYATNLPKERSPSSDSEIILGGTVERMKISLHSRRPHAPSKIPPNPSPSARRSPSVSKIKSRTMFFKTNKKTTIALLIPSTSKGTRTVESLPIFDHILHYAKQTITPEEKKKFNFIIYLGFDEGDPLYDSELHASNFAKMVSASVEGFPISLKMLKMRGFTGAPCLIWNDLFKVAYEDGCDYFYQLNDDIVLKGAGWATDFTTALQSNSLMKNLGVVGPLDLGNQKTMTQSFVHRTHYEIFKSYYPKAFRNWYSDDWMTHVYGPLSTFQSKDHPIQNRNPKGQRYREDNSHRALVAPELNNACIKIREYFKLQGRDPMTFSCDHGKLYWERHGHNRR